MNINAWVRQLLHKRININHTMLLDLLRLFIFCIIICAHCLNITNRYSDFDIFAKPLAKSGLLFSMAAASTGECLTIDFLSFYAGAVLNRERLESKTPIDLYDPFVLTEAMERIIAPIKPQGTFCLQYPPIFFALVTPLAYFDLYTAWRIWFFVLAICVSLAYIFIAYKALDARPLLLGGLLIALFTFPVSENFLIGQTTCIEAAIIALSFRLLIDKKYFWAGLIAGASILKLQQTLIILIPGFCVGKSKFFRGFLIMLFIETLLSILVVGYDNVPNFLKTNYMSEIAHSFSDMNEGWDYLTFVGMLQYFPWFTSNATKIGALAFVLVFLAALGLWLKVYPALQKISDCSIELIGSITTIALLIFSLHGYWYDYVLYIIPCLWLYLWSTSAEASYSLKQSIIRFMISIVVFYVPFFGITFRYS